MRSSATAQLTIDDGYGLRGFIRRMLTRASGLVAFTLVAFCLAALGTWNVADPSFSHATDNVVQNAMGYPGAVVSDLLMQFFGLASVAGLLPGVAWGVWLASARNVSRVPSRCFAWLAATALAAGMVGCLEAPATWPLPSGLGGVIGDLVLALPARFAGGYPTGFSAIVTAGVLSLPTLWLFAFACAVLGRRNVEEAPASEKAKTRKVVRHEEEEMEVYDDEEDQGSRILAAFGAVTHWWLSGKAFLRRKLNLGALPLKRREYDDEDDFDFAPSRGSSRGERIEPGFTSPRSRDVDEPPFDVDEGDYQGDAYAQYDEDDDFDDDVVIKPTPAGGSAQVRHYRSDAATRVDMPAARPKPASRASRQAQASAAGSHSFILPALEFLSEPRNVGRDPSLSQDALEQNARLLEGVLEDFGVKGEIIHVRPGPVVTMYELEPAPGIKSSRVIGLADDIARSMSAIACRVAVVPGRNAIGIELPNTRRETVYLREILASRDFEQTKAKLALALGKSINGEAVIADITKMPHVLVAGTTGSGKSVAINTMILSLVYRMRPEECRLIMIDPKMLELSVYDGIPHLLTPVVTDPKKAVVALKWTVREMEDRYRKMSKVGVRNIDGFNQRVGQARRNGEQITRTVQTGFDRQTGEAIYETEHLDLEPMPYIVVIIDEMADLMMVAGKDIEGAVQRLAQMARAAGIHVIMATQRPSVDVITGTIKANFPTRISFQVTSKIDSRTILGEMGAEQLLGMGDMLYMAGGGRIQRVHGPFVSDDEVEQVVAHLKLQGVPEYLDAITEDDEDEDAGGKGGGGNFEDSDDPYDQAVAIVLRDGKASTSYIQRRLGIGYNRAASIIERMEEEGVVGPANHAGKREILVPTEEDRF
ncbi:FtsK/SpoIIIE family DNA translocase [Aquamicrobium zhengzhouense]|uniref:DNA translocase FtsK n=1 Tax=Aquamicrobium zhengzhouense TaxID=2781738 RepID=A0ABS0SFM8_9HYPH|nr:DNA translocase FtsK [Aquamicrobium zhengzhouense]MBI1622108.1 DNA translocase FtsK [Aquamicrobium zhengzhouense]